MFPELNVPAAKLQLKERKSSDGSVYLVVIDQFRKKELKLTPEEWVRQHFFHHLVNDKKVPISLLASEYAIDVNSLKRRCDGVVFNRSGKPIAIIECKAPHIKLNEDTLYQIAQYNFKLRVSWLILTNGMQTITCFVNLNERKLSYLQEIPNYEALCKVSL